MTEYEFHKSRGMFYFNTETLQLIFAPIHLHRMSHIGWFQEENIPYIDTIRGYTYDDTAVFYCNDFEIPDMSTKLITYLFDLLQTIECIGLGCIRGKIGEVWEPKLKIYRTWK